ncbi:uncharacterized protein LY89DRAFT_759797 [Mollisia scopiformis]|uniref:Uncharacterized protein n=1 Tax=Mollisia scopiformis TaxID=149040 RepID=A0A194WSC5_MOLSC|nr:uncharacterized protein LY89DRAFT_759797 [Mollisia scopiformis]KUJ10868.1 hypothetical protein LY89DRAFT_759797 [Mollisia scopiformis]
MVYCFCPSLTCALVIISMADMRGELESVAMYKLLSTELEDESSTQSHQTNYRRRIQTFWIFSKSIVFYLFVLVGMFCLVHGLPAIFHPGHDSGIMRNPCGQTSVEAQARGCDGTSCHLLGCHKNASTRI